MLLARLSRKANASREIRTEGAYQFYAPKVEAYTGFCAMQCSEAAMEKHPSRSLAKRVSQANDESFNLSSLVIGRHAKGPDKPERVPDKPSREDVSRCINIWASMYLLGNEQSDAADLSLPSRPWMGRSPNSIKRFE